MSVQTVKHKPIILGLTGGIASGKSTAANYFKTLGIPVIDSDLIVKQLWQTHQEMKVQAQSLFGFEIVGKADFKKIAEIIFKDENMRHKLNAIVHPFVFEAIENEKKQLTDHKFIVIDMPLLIEVGYQKKVDHVLLVYVSKDTQIKRLMTRDHLTFSDAEKRVNSQLDLDMKKAFSDVILNNEQDVLNLYQSIESFLRGIGYEK